MKVVLYSCANQGRAGHIAHAMQAGLLRHGLDAKIEHRWNGRVAGDLAIAYGWKHEPVFSAYAAAGAQYAYFDMGYFNRKPSGDKGGSREGHHRLAVNDWDTAVNMKRGCPSDRWDALEIEVQPDHHPNGSVLVAGMSAKAAGTHGFRDLEWETSALAALRAINIPDEEINYRPKPRHLGEVEPIEAVLRRTRVIITHHSNVAVDGLVMGVPCYAVKGVGKLVSNDVFATPGLGLTWKPAPSRRDRLALLADVAYAQWTPDEMRSGEAWAHIRGIVR
jgi:hypothetical protein